MPATDEQRASPDALLAIAKKEGRGRLKIYLGAAPGVGKTYVMLAAAQEERASGRDVTVGLVETHGRHETETMVAGFEVLPRQRIAYQHRLLNEFDLDAALERKPDLLLVDEYAHTNVPGTRHPKRWQDVDELLAAGINVWTTLNIQHLESLNDVIRTITRVRVRETVPDKVFEAADEIVLVDFPPDELLKRLAEGKVYVQETAARAAQGFFKPQNLTALRELALRRAAERVDTSLVGQMQAQAIEGPWAAGERILACVGTAPSSASVVRTAKRLADMMDAPWIAVTVERPSLPMTEAQRKNAEAALKLAESLGAETHNLIANDLPAEILRFARYENVTQIVVGRAERNLLSRPFQPTLAQELVRQAEDIAIHILTGRREKRRWKLGALIVPTPPGLSPFLWSALYVALAGLVGEALTFLTPLPNLSMIFLLAVLFSAVRYGMWPAIIASALAFAVHNFFFIDPVHTFTIARPHELLALLIFLVVAIITSTLAGRVRNQAKRAVIRMRAARRLYEFTRKLSGLATRDDVAEGAALEIHATLARPAIILLGETGELRLKAAWPPEDTLDTPAVTAAHWAFTRDEPAGAHTGTLPTVPWLFLPLKTPRGLVGVIGVGVTPAEEPLDAEALAFLDALAQQTAVALERAGLMRDMVAVKSAAETERVRNTLLASISHDFRTPLASILGSATSILDFGDRLDENTKKDLLKQVRDEAEGLDTMVRNLLAIARIDAGGLELRYDWVDLRETASRAANLARRRGALQHIRTDMPENLPLVRADATLVEQALGNVIENALTHTPPETNILISAAADANSVALDVTDNGPGINPEMLPYVFEKYRRADHATRNGASGHHNTGLGLAIAKGIADAHNGSISVDSPVADGKGTRIRMAFPIEGPDPMARSA